MAPRTLLRLLFAVLPLVLLGSCKDSTKPNTDPIAIIGPDQSVNVGEVVTLDGSSSIDPDGDVLTYTWVFTSRPPGSNALLTGASNAIASFTPDAGGQYVIQLSVSDGKAIGTDDCIVTVNAGPSADAGTDKIANVGEMVQLDGSGSSDPEGDNLAYTWSFESRPAGSNVTLSSTTSSTPSFTPDVGGVYELELVVSDGKLTSSPDYCTVTVNSLPVANAGADQSVEVGDLVSLNGSGSSDPDGDNLTYSWSFESRPASSTAALSSLSATNPSFIPDVAGAFIVALSVSDGKATSAPDFVTIMVTAPPPTLSLTGTWAGDDVIGATWTLFLTDTPSSSAAIGPEASSSSTISGTWEISAGSTVILSGGTVSGSKNNFDVQMRLSLSGYQPTDITGTVSADGQTITGVMDGSGYVNDPIVLRRMGGSSVGAVERSESSASGTELLAEFLKRTLGGMPPSPE